MHLAFFAFMLLMVLLIPVVMLFFGGEFIRRPGVINSGCGYRTRRSLASQEAWDFAHKYCGRLWQKIGRWMLLLSALVMAPALGFSVSGIGSWAVGVLFLQTAAMIATIFPVERALKRNFDQFGHRITEKEPK